MQPSNLEENVSTFFSLFPHLRPDMIISLEKNSDLDLPPTSILPPAFTLKECVTRLWDIQAIPGKLRTNKSKAQLGSFDMRRGFCLSLSFFPLIYVGYVQTCKMIIAKKGRRYDRLAADVLLSELALKLKFRPSRTWEGQRAQ